MSHLCCCTGSAVSSHDLKSAPSVSVLSKQQRRPPTAGVCAPERSTWEEAQSWRLKPEQLGLYQQRCHMPVASGPVLKTAVNVGAFPRTSWAIYSSTLSLIWNAIFKDSRVFIVTVQGTAKLLLSALTCIYSINITLIMREQQVIWHSSTSWF